MVKMYQLSPSAFSPPSPVALSKVQDATLRIVTYHNHRLAVWLATADIVLLAVIGLLEYITPRGSRRRGSPLPAPILV